MKLHRTRRILVQNLILFLLSLFIAVGWQNRSVAIQPAELVARDRMAQINVRIAPSTTAELIGFAVAGDQVEILSQTQSSDGYTWYQMQSNRSGIAGWVRGDLVKLLAGAPQPRLNSSEEIAAIQKSPIVPQSSNCAPVYPVAIPVVNQGFGQVSDPSNPGQTHLHTGIDFDGRVGDPINSPVCGVVTYVGREQNEADYEWGYGWQIKIRDNEGRIHLFAHISRANVKVGQTVIPGQLIAGIGNNGNSTGPHLHYEIRQGADDYRHAIDPSPFLVSAGQGGVTQAGTPPIPNQSPLRF